MFLRLFEVLERKQFLSVFVWGEGAFHFTVSCLTWTVLDEGCFSCSWIHSISLLIKPGCWKIRSATLEERNIFCIYPVILSQQGNSDEYSCFPWVSGRQEVQDWGVYVQKLVQVLEPFSFLPLIPPFPADLGRQQSGTVKSGCPSLLERASITLSHCLGQVSQLWSRIWNFSSSE